MAKSKKKRHQIAKQEQPRAEECAVQRERVQRERRDPFEKVPLAPICVGLLLVVLLASRFVNLGYQGFHHDESIHCKHSWDFVNTPRGPASHRYDPVYHGPFLYHFGALFEFFAQPEKPDLKAGETQGPFYHHLLPDSDFAARTPYATVGVFLVAVFLLWRRWLGWGTCLLVMGLLTISPIVNYFSRFARNDVYQTAWLAGTIVTGSLYIWRGKIRYLTFGSFFLVLSYCTKENSYANNFSFCSFLVLWGIWRISRYGKKGLTEVFVDRFPLARLLLLYGCFSFFVFSYVAIDCRVGPETGLLHGLKNIITHSTSIREKADVTVFKDSSGREVSGYFSAAGREDVNRAYLHLGFTVTLLLLVSTEFLSLWWEREKRNASRGGWLAKCVVACLFYWFLSIRLRAFAGWTQLTPQDQWNWSPYGIEFLGNWVRGGPPGPGRHLAPTSFLLMSGLNLILDSLLLGFVSLGFALPDAVRNIRSRQTGESEVSPRKALGLCSARLWGLWGSIVQIAIAVALFTLLFSYLGTDAKRGTVAGLYDYLSYWFKHQTGDYRIWGAWWYHIPRLLLYELFPLVLVVLAGCALPVGWVATFLKGGQRGEKTGTPPPQAEADKGRGRSSPIVSEALPSEATPTGMGIGSSIWKPVPTPLLAFSAYLFVFMLGLYAALNEKVPWLLTYQAFSLSLFGALLTGHWLATHSRSPGPIVGRFMDFSHPPSGIAIGTGAWVRMLVSRLSLLLVVVFFLLFTLGQHLTTVFFRPDQPTELLVYTATTHDFAEQMRRIARMRERAGRDGGQIRIAVYGQEGKAEVKAEWPSYWYLRNDDVAWKRFDLSRDVQILDDTPANRRRMNPRRGNKWDVCPCWLRGWWIWHGTPHALPGKLDLLPNIKAFLLNARNDCRNDFRPDIRPEPEDYPLGFRTQILNYVFFRKVWFPTGGEEILVCYKTDEPVEVEDVEGYLEGSEQPATPLVASQFFGSRGSEPGQFQQPRGLALTPQGNIAVADSKNGRIQVLSPAGEPILSFGQGVLSSDVSGVGDVDCSSAGEFYVADTWSGAIRKFSADGNLLATADVAKGENDVERMFGPRGIALDGRARVLVTDTGNKCIRLFDSDLEPLSTWGAPGDGPGQLNEPVGIAVDRLDRVYVADTGNGRIQRFSPEGDFEAEFLALPFPSEQVVQVEPYLEVLPDGRIVVTYSTAGTVWFVDTENRTVQIRRIVRPNLPSPLGVAVDETGQVWIGDKTSSSIVRIAAP